MPRGIAIALTFLLLFLGVTACKKTVEGETKSWDANVKKVEAMKARYPGLKEALDSRLSSAKEVKAKADDLAEEAKAEQLSAANSALMKGFVGDLAKLDKKIEKLRKSRVDVTAKAGDASTREAAKIAAGDASKAIERVESALKSGAKDEAGANAVVKAAIKDLDVAQKAIDSVAKTDKSKKKDAASKDKKANDAAAAKDAAAKAAVADWKCGHCDSMNKHDATKCASCGAPKPAKK